MSSASTSVMVLTTMTLRFQGPGARHKQVRCYGALGPPDKAGEQGNKWLALGDLLSHNLVLSCRRFCGCKA